MAPRAKLPIVSGGSLGWCDIRNHSTSIGAPESLTVATSVLSDDQVAADARLAVGSPGDDAGDAAVLLDQIGDLGLHYQPKGRITFCLCGNEIQEVPLRHHGNELSPHRQVAEVGDHRFHSAEADIHRWCRLMRSLQQPVIQSELIHDL